MKTLSDSTIQTAPALRSFSPITATAVFLSLMSIGVCYAQTVNLVYAFDGTGAAGNPLNVTPVQGRNGKLYGTTSGLVYGTIFSVPASRTKTAAFPYIFGTSGGSNPGAGLTLGTDGNFYGAATLGGAANFGVVFKVIPSGGYTVLHEFTGGADGAYPSASPIWGQDGRLYGTTPGTRDGSIPPTIYRCSTSGSCATIYQFDQAHGASVFAPVIQGTDGNLYGTASSGGANGNGSVVHPARTGHGS